MAYTAMANIKKDKKWGTKQYPENLRLSNMVFITMGELR